MPENPLVRLQNPLAPGYQICTSLHAEGILRMSACPFFAPKIKLAPRALNQFVAFYLLIPCFILCLFFYMYTGVYVINIYFCHALQSSCIEAHLKLHSAVPAITSEGQCNKHLPWL